MSSSKFPPGFLWGAATSAYQIEGFPLEDGAGPSNWHRFSHTPGRIVNGDTGDRACEHYRRYPEDVQLMRALGLNAYRFSLSWSRILPEGRGAVNQRGLDFYQRLVDLLLENGIQPLVTLFHWDLPAPLDDQGGWANRDIADWFADYAEVVFRALDDRVKMWVTLNEPWVVSDGGYLHGILAPGDRNPFKAARASHNLLRAHGQAVSAYRATGSHQIGLVVNLEPKYPASTSEADLAATARADAYMNRQFLDPVFKGAYPDEMAEIFGEAWPVHPHSDFESIAQPIDFLGINYYKRSVTKADPTVDYVRASDVPQPQSTHTIIGWEVAPGGLPLRDILQWVTERYGRIPLYVTENGSAFYDPPAAEGGAVSDPLRTSYLRSHLRACAEAIASGVDLRGYCAWSLLDNFEWAVGYSARFGLIHVNYATQERTIKDSGKFYAEVIRTNGASLWGGEEHDD
ncbi:MAG: GH1 family beta-glucosidase [Thermoanaerobaculia bacterium]